MRQFFTIASNAFMELVRQPVFLLLLTCSAVFSVFLAAVPYFGFGDDPKLVKDSTLAVMLLSGLFGAVLNASASVAHEIRSGTALAVLAKPVGRAQFLLAKYLGLAAALTVLTYVNALSALLASRMAFDAYGDADTRSLGIYCGMLGLGYAGAGLINYFLRRPFVANAVLAVVVMATLAFVVIVCFTQTKNRFGMTPNEVDWRLAPAAILILFALLVLAGLALACSTRFEMIPTLAICTGIFLLGLMSDYLFGRRAEPVWRASLQAELDNPQLTGGQKKLLKEVAEKYDMNKDGRLDLNEQESLSAADKQQLSRAGLGGRWWASVLYTVVPNWQLFWLADALEGKNQIPWSYVGRALGYVIGYLGASLALALLLFEERELT
jgi:ABC-type transport system involved in multi-copper enzyme maturation permease subunit